MNSDCVFDVLNFRRAFRRALIDLKISSDHHGTWPGFWMPEERGMEFSAACMIKSVKDERACWVFDVGGEEGSVFC